MEVTFFLNILLAIISFVIAAYLLYLVRINSVLRKLNNGMKNVVNKSQKLSTNRKKKEEEIRIDDGGQEKTSFFYKVDLSLIQSGISHKFPFITTEIFLCIVAGTMAAAFIIGIRYSFLIAFIAACLSGFMYYILLFLLSSINYRKTESQIISFVGMMKDYSRTSDDIVTILQNVSVYLEEPLKSVVEECCMEATTTGDVSAAITRMSLKIEHKEFKKIMNNLEICSRHKANYGEVISRSMDQLRNYIASKEEARRIVSNGRRQIILIDIVGVICFFMMNDLAEEGILSFMQKTFAGNCILLYLFLVILWSTWKMISMGQKD